MNPQSWRRSIVLLNVVLTLGLLATGVWWFTRVRPDDAAAARPQNWTAPTFEQYELEARRARSVTVWPVDEQMIKQILRPDDLMKPREKGGSYTWPYIGPVPPSGSKLETPPK